MRGHGLARPAGHAPLKVDWALGTGQAIGARTGAGKQCANAIEAGVGGRAEYVIPDWVGSMAGSVIFSFLMSNS